MQIVLERPAPEACGPGPGRVACSNAFLVALGHPSTLMLRLETSPAVLHGSVSVFHPINPTQPHVVTVELYETAAPHPFLPGVTFAPPVPMPTALAIQVAVLSVP